jgi:peptide/nickel transport system permease protein
MTQYIMRRLLLMIPTLLGVTVMISIVIRLLPGDAAQQIAAGQGAGGLSVETIRHELGLDRSWPRQYADWLTGALRGDLGYSLYGKNRTVNQELKERVPVTVELAIVALAVALLVAIPIGIYSAIRQDHLGDYVARSFAIAMLAVPTFWIATLVVVFAPRIFGNSLPIFYKQVWDDPVANLKQVWVPALILGFAISGAIMRLTRAQMLEVMRQDYVRTASAKGLRERVVISRHAFKNALIPVITLVGLQIPVLIGGSVVLEAIFVLPGIGSRLLTSLATRDYPVALGINLVVAVTIVVTNFVVDLAYAMLDPRIRLS